MGSWTQFCNGTIFCGSVIRLQDIPDGSSHTLMVAEKYMNQANYLTGGDPADNENMYIGDDRDIRRFTGTEAQNGNNDPSINYLPRRDRGYATASSDVEEHNSMCFGSAHPSSFNCIMCDSSVHSVSYTIDGASWSRLGNRKDGKGISADASQGTGIGHQSCFPPRRGNAARAFLGRAGTRINHTGSSPV